MLRINYTSVMVDDQDKALKFYTEVLGFQTKNDIPLGEEFRWITVVSPATPDGVELCLEPAAHPACPPFREAMVNDGIPWTAFVVDDVEAEVERLRDLGVVFTTEPADMGTCIVAVFDDTCGNLIQLMEVK